MFPNGIKLYKNEKAEVGRNVYNSWKEFENSQDYSDLPYIVRIAIQDNFKASKKGVSFAQVFVALLPWIICVAFVVIVILTGGK